MTPMPDEMNSKLKLSYMISYTMISTAGDQKKLFDRKFTNLVNVKDRN